LSGLVVVAAVEAAEVVMTLAVTFGLSMLMLQLPLEYHPTPCH
jgi:threonine/homoserine/homoserine lactone efflux protein